VDIDRYAREAVATAAALVNAVTSGQGDPAPRQALPAAERRRLADAVLTRAPLADGDEEAVTTLALRLRSVFESAADGDLDGAAAAVNALLDDHRAGPRLVSHDGQPWHLHFHRDDGGAVGAWGASFATGLAMVIGVGDACRLGRCAADGCDGVFLDLSRNGTRRFCSDACMNRTKVAAFRARAKAGAAAGR
jgi:predicted RNA-binding Zn ribbon-like protein